MKKVRLKASKGRKRGQWVEDLQAELHDEFDRVRNFVVKFNMNTLRF